MCRIVKVISTDMRVVVGCVSGQHAKSLLQEYSLRSQSCVSETITLRGGSRECSAAATYRVTKAVYLRDDLESSLACCSNHSSQAQKVFSVESGRSQRLEVVVVQHDSDVPAGARRCKKAVHHEEVCGERQWHSGRVLSS